MEKPPEHDCEDGSPKFVDQERVEDLCCSCGQLAVDAHVAPCGHVYGGVMTQTLKTKGIDSFYCCGKGEDGNDCGETILVCDLRPDRAISNSLRRRLVRCINVNAGCERTMMLREHAQHLQQSCPHEPMDCPKCRKKWKRVNLPNHLPACTSVKCTYAKAGCKQILDSEEAKDRHDLDALGWHLAIIYRSFKQHLSVVKYSDDNLRTALAEETDNVVGQEEMIHMLNHPGAMREQSAAVQNLVRNLTDSSDKAKQAAEQFEKMMKVDLPTQLAEPVLRLEMITESQEKVLEKDTGEAMAKLMQKTLDAPKMHYYGSVVYRFTEYSRKKVVAMETEESYWDGPEFCTHQFGYLLVPSLYPNGVADGENTSIAATVSLKKGTYDGLLQWPFLFYISFSILAQRGGRNTPERRIITRPTGENDLRFLRPGSAFNIPNRSQGFGVTQLLDLNQLRQPSEFLIDDTLFLKIVVKSAMPQQQ